MKHLLSFNESVRDLMKPKSEEDILKSLKQKSKKHRNDLFYKECVSSLFNINKLKMLLDSDVDIDLQDELGGNTRLMDASAVGNYDVVDLLIKHGADINLKNNYGKTALYIASVNRKNDIVDLLKKHGAKE